MHLYAHASDEAPRAAATFAPAEADPVAPAVTAHSPGHNPVLRDGIEPPTRGFSVPATEPGKPRQVKWLRLLTG